MAYERKTIDIFISDELRDFLSQIAHDSVVASLLLKRRHVKEDLVDEPVNYISISSVDKSKISYLTQERINSLQKTLFGIQAVDFKQNQVVLFLKYSRIFQLEKLKSSLTFFVLLKKEQVLN